MAQAGWAAVAGFAQVLAAIVECESLSYDDRLALTRLSVECLHTVLINFPLWPNGPAPPVAAEPDVLSDAPTNPGSDGGHSRTDSPEPENGRRSEA